MAKLRVGPKALALIKSFEGCKLEAYPDPGTGGEPITIGWGYTQPGVVKLGDRLPQWAADALFEATVDRFADGVRDLLGEADTDAAQFGALVSLAYNIGLSALARSTVLKRHKAGDFAGAAKAFGAWSKANGRVMPGLSRRRAAEAALYRLYR